MPAVITAQQASMRRREEARAMLSGPRTGKAREPIAVRPAPCHPGRDRIAHRPLPRTVNSCDLIHSLSRIKSSVRPAQVRPRPQAAVPPPAPAYDRRINQAAGLPCVSAAHCPSTGRVGRASKPAGRDRAMRTIFMTRGGERGRRPARLLAGVAVLGAVVSPVAASGTASAASSGDVTPAVLAGHNVTLAGDAVVRLPAGTTVYSGTISGEGTLTIQGTGTLILTKDS